MAKRVEPKYLIINDASDTGGGGSPRWVNMRLRRRDARLATCHSGQMAEGTPDVEMTAEIHPQWPIDAAASPTVINQVAIIENIGLSGGGDDGTMTLLMGFLAPPMMGSNQAALEYLEATQGQLPVNPAGAFLLTHGRIRELRDMLDKALSRHDKSDDTMETEDKS